MKAKSEGRRHPPAKRPACRRPGAGRWAGNEECRSGEKLWSGIRAQPLGCRGWRQLWRTRERRQIVESAVTVRREPRRTGFEFRRPRQALFRGWLGNLVEREGVIKCLTVRYLMSPGAESLFGNYKGRCFRGKGSEGDCRNAAVHAAAFSHFRHIGPRRGWVGYRRGEETAPCMGRLRRLPPEGGVPGSREETARCLVARGGEAGARAGLASAGCSADAPACGASRWIKVGADETRFGPRALDAGRF